jgi:hypothetical protein
MARLGQKFCPIAYFARRASQPAQRRAAIQCRRAEGYRIEHIRDSGVCPAMTGASVQAVDDTSLANAVQRFALHAPERSTGRPRNPVAYGRHSRVRARQCLPAPRQRAGTRTSARGDWANRSVARHRVWPPRRHKRAPSAERRAHRSSHARSAAGVGGRSKAVRLQER